MDHTIPFTVEDRGMITPCHICKRVDKRAHRLVWIAVYGDIPPRWHVHHICRVLACINAEHLMLMSPSQHTTYHNNYNKRLILGNRLD